MGFMDVYFGFKFFDIFLVLRHYVTLLKFKYRKIEEKIYREVQKKYFFNKFLKRFFGKTFEPF
jgi:hypothetical protein